MLALFIVGNVEKLKHKDDAERWVNTSENLSSRVIEYGEEYSKVRHEGAQVIDTRFCHSQADNRNDENEANETHLKCEFHVNWWVFTSKT